jgi:prephenate dehydrogenase
LYQDRRTILTPLSSNSMRHTKQAHDIWSAMGRHVSTMTAADHDQTFAAVSHLPHLLAFAAVHALTTHPQGADYLDMAGPGFRDFSRIAASDPAVWRDILSANRTEVLAQLAHFRASLAQFEAAMQQGDTTGLQQLIQQASDVRSGWALQAGNG